MTTKLTQSHLTHLKHPTAAAHRDSAVERAWSCFTHVSGPVLAAGACWRGENMGTSGGSRQALALHHGRTSAWKLHYVPAVGLAVALSKNNFWQDDVFWQVQRGILQARLLQEEEREEEVLAIIMWGVFSSNMSWPVYIGSQALMEDLDEALILKGSVFFFYKLISKKSMICSLNWPAGINKVSWIRIWMSTGNIRTRLCQTLKPALQVDSQVYWIYLTGPSCKEPRENVWQERRLFQKTWNLIGQTFCLLLYIHIYIYIQQNSRMASYWCEGWHQTLVTDSSVVFRGGLA